MLTLVSFMKEVLGILNKITCLASNIWVQKKTKAILNMGFGESSCLDFEVIPFSKLISIDGYYTYGVQEK